MASQALRSFLRSYPGVTGLTGVQADVDAAAKAFGVSARRPDDETIQHTDLIYVLDLTGEYRTSLHATSATVTPQRIATELAAAAR